MSEQAREALSPDEQLDYELAWLTNHESNASNVEMIQAMALASIAQSLRRIENYLRRLAG